MAKPVPGSHSCTGGLALVDAQLLDVLAMIRDQRALAGELVGLLKDVALTLREDRDIPCPPTLGPGRLQREVIAAVRVARLELNGLFASQAEGRLEHESHTDIDIGFSAMLFVW